MLLQPIGLESKMLWRRWERPLSREHVEHLKRLTKKLVLVYDGDKAGQAAILKALDEIGDMPVQIVSMPDNLILMSIYKKWSRRLGLSINKNSY